MKAGDFNDEHSSELNSMILPQMEHDNSYLLGIFGTGGESLHTHLRQSIEKLHNLQGISKDNIFIKAARIHKDKPFMSDNEVIASFSSATLKPYATYVGKDYESARIRGLLEQGGIIVIDDLDVTRTTDVVLRKVIGYENIFNSDIVQQVQSKKKKRWWSK